ncbi:MAG: hypothetical protein JSR54_19890, partial [Proteobacteria bacterium]|nr:hypothetical protein [Pseudomonadota bacterium]
GDAALAARFVDERHRETFERAVARAAGYYAENARLGEFWSGTADAYAACAAPAIAGPVRIERRAVLESGRIRERPVLVTPAAPRGAWRVAGVPVVDLYELLRAGGGRGTLADVAQRLDCAPAAVASARRWLEAAGVLTSSGGV